MRSEIRLLTPGEDAPTDGGPVLRDGEVSAVGVAAWAERAPLEALEVMIGTGQAAFVILGLCFRAIERRRTWPDVYPTFPDYCAGKWGLAYPTAAQLMRCAEVMVLLEEGHYDNVITALPATYRVAHELSPLRESPGELAAAWQEAMQTAPRKADGRARVTAQHLRAVVTRYRPALAGRREALVRAQLEGAPAPATGAIDLDLQALAKAVAERSAAVRRRVGRPAFASACDEVDVTDLREALRGAEHWLKRAERTMAEVRRRARGQRAAADDDGLA